MGGGGRGNARDALDPPMHKGDSGEMQWTQAFQSNTNHLLVVGTGCNEQVWMYEYMCVFRGLYGEVFGHFVQMSSWRITIRWLCSYYKVGNWNALWTVNNEYTVTDYRIFNRATYKVSLNRSKASELARHVHGEDKQKRSRHWILNFAD